MGELYSIKDELNSQDNMGTENPIFLVYSRRERVGNPDYEDDVEWQFIWDTSLVAKNREDLLKFCEENELSTDIENLEFKEACEKLIEENKGDCWMWPAVEEKHLEYVGFTRRGAEAFIKSNSHNLRKPFIYCFHCHRNGEMKTIRRFLMKHDLKALHYYSEDNDFENVKLTGDSP